jgi:hypothetical protein
MARWWSASAVIALNTAILFLLVNGAASIVERATQPPTVESRRTAVDERTGTPLSPVYPGMSDDDIVQLLTETWSRTHAYEPFTGHTERPFAGRYVNVAEHGVRSNRVANPWPPPAEGTVFVLGGSTTFGVGVADSQTIPSYLERELRARIGPGIHVYNFGRGYYYSSLERALFARLIEERAVPTVAVFIDGLNDFILEEPPYAGRLRQFMDGTLPRPTAAGSLAVVRVGRRALARLTAGRGNRSASGPDPVAVHTTQAVRDSTVMPVIERYLTNKRMVEAIAASEGIATLFVWQPVPVHGYDNRYNPYLPRAGWVVRSGERTRFGYERFAQVRDSAPSAYGLLWLADMQREDTTALYVDQVHYTAALSKRIAERIADAIVERRLLTAPVNASPAMSGIPD